MKEIILPSAYYPWEKWFKHKTIILVQYVDFQCQPHSMAQQVRNAAARLDVKLAHVTINNEVVTVKVKRGLR